MLRKKEFLGKIFGYQSKGSSVSTLLRGEILANGNSVANGSIDGSDSLKANGVNVEVESESSSSSSSESENEDSSFLDKMKDRVSDAIGV